LAILRRALEAPMMMIAQNAGEDGAVVLGNVRRMQKEQNNVNLAYEVISGEYKDMLKAGITDPAKVTRSAVENAASIAAMILTTAALITDIPEKEKAQAAPPMPDY
jgi:chaperonin GroEL